MPFSTSAPPLQTLLSLFGTVGPGQVGLSAGYSPLEQNAKTIHSVAFLGCAFVLNPPFQLIHVSFRARFCAVTGAAPPTQNSFKLVHFQ